MNETGFYKLEGADEDGNAVPESVVLFSNSTVIGPDFILLPEYGPLLTEPKHGWQWFTSRVEAFAAFGVPDDTPIM